MKKYTIRDFDRQFPNDDVCLEFLKDARWPNGISCDTCGRVTKHHRIMARKVYSCDHCGTHVSPTAGTIFHKSRTPLKSWFHAMFLMASTRTGISAKQLEREIGVTYKTAWRMFKEIRKLMDEDIEPMGGPVEVDETYIGGRDKFRHASKRFGIRGRGAGGKSVVVGAVKRKGKIAAKVAPDVSAKTLMPFIKSKVMPRSIVFTDELRSYHGLQRAGYDHRRVQHAAKIYVSGDAHTNTIEGFWSLVKRGLSGVNHVVSRKYLQGYIDTYTFRWNHRGDNRPMFLTLLNRIPALADGQVGLPYVGGGQMHSWSTVFP